MKEITEREMKRRGEMIISLLGLKSEKIQRVSTAWGTKTPLGLFLTLKRLIEEGE